MLVNVLVALGVWTCVAQAGQVNRADPLVIGDTFTIASAALHETRRINVYAPPEYAESRPKVAKSAPSPPRAP